MAGLLLFTMFVILYICQPEIMAQLMYIQVQMFGPQFRENKNESSQSSNFVDYILLNSNFEYNAI